MERVLNYMWRCIMNTAFNNYYMAMDVSFDLNEAMLGLIKLDQEMEERSEAFDKAWNALCHAQDKLSKVIDINSQNYLTKSK